MIPLGNWQERIDELESENFDLLEENRRLDDEITDLLYEIDTLKGRLSKAQEERDKLRKEALHLRSELYGGAEAEIAQLYARANAAERRVKELEKLLAEETNRAETAEVSAEDYRNANDAWTSSFEIMIEAYDEAQARANSWFEIAKNLVRSRQFWIELADQEMERADKAENTVDELKSALRVLGS